MLLRGKEEDSLTASTIWPLALTDLHLHRATHGPHFLPCPAHVHFEAQITVPKATWHCKTK